MPLDMPVHAVDSEIVAQGSEHRYLSMPEMHMSKAGAIRLALSTIRETVPSATGLTETELRAPSRRYTTVDAHGDTVTHTFDDFVEVARRTGTISVLRSAPDPVFGQSFAMACSENMTLKNQQFGHEVEVRGPCQVFPIGPDLVRDILYYRREICEHSTMPAISTVARLHRAYLLSCTTLVEAFLNRYLWYFRAIGRITTEQFDSLTLSFEPRLDGWLSLLVGKTLEDLKKVTPCWNHLVELRTARNLIAHAPDPTAGLSMHDVHRSLNSARTGVAGTLSKLREWIGQPPASFLEPLATAPEVSFVTAMKRKKAPRH